MYASKSFRIYETTELKGEIGKTTITVGDFKSDHPNL